MINRELMFCPPVSSRKLAMHFELGLPSDGLYDTITLNMDLSYIDKFSNSIVIDWGDGNVETLYAGDESKLTHTYVGFTPSSGINYISFKMYTSAGDVPDRLDNTIPYLPNIYEVIYLGKIIKSNLYQQENLYRLFRKDPLNEIHEGILENNPDTTNLNAGFEDQTNLINTRIESSWIKNQTKLEYINYLFKNDTSFTSVDYDILVYTSRLKSVTQTFYKVPLNGSVINLQFNSNISNASGFMGGISSSGKSIIILPSNSTTSSTFSNLVSGTDYPSDVIIEHAEYWLAGTTNNNNNNIVIGSTINTENAKLPSNSGPVIITPTSWKFQNIDSIQYLPVFELDSSEASLDRSYWELDPDAIGVFQIYDFIDKEWKPHEADFTNLVNYLLTKDDDDVVVLSFRKDTTV